MLKATPCFLSFSEPADFRVVQKKGYSEGNDTLLETFFYFNLKHKQFFALQF